MTAKAKSDETILFNAKNVDSYSTAIAGFAGTVVGITSRTRAQAHTKVEHYFESPMRASGLDKENKNLTPGDILGLCKLVAQEALRCISDYERMTADVRGQD